LSNFNISVAITDAFMHAVGSDSEFELVHLARPIQSLIDAGAYQRPSDGHWVYRKVQARELMDEIVRSTYDHADPGVVFIDRMNAENNLQYTEVIEATNPCSEQSLPDYGCCCLGSIDLTRFVIDAFSDAARFDWDAFSSVVRTAVHMLDNVLEVTYWPLPEQRREAQLKRRIGLGFLGLGSALVMMRTRYNSAEGYSFGAKVAQTMRDEAYSASIALAGRKGSVSRPGCATLSRKRLRTKVAAAHPRRHPRRWHPQQPPAVDRAHRDDRAGLRGQRVQRHRAGVLLGLFAQEAHARQLDQAVPGRGSRLPAVRQMGGDVTIVARVLRVRHGHERR
jgi:ribonucleotide reductase alpha subunit